MTAWVSHLELLVEYSEMTNISNIEMIAFKIAGATFKFKNVQLFLLFCNFKKGQVVFSI